MTLAPGTTVGRYQILEPLGQGGMATVYKAFQPSLQREVALKVLRPGYAQDQEFRERFEREAIAIARLRHPHIVQVFDFEIAGSGEYVLAMEFLEGGTLKDRLTKLAAEGRGLDPAQSVRILGEVAQALSYAHEKGVIHRDVKPSNVMLTQKDWAVVTDFGIARILGATSHTQTGVGIGTPEYMAPEQGQGGHVDHHADIYSLGAMAYELLTGHVPYSADTPLAVVLAHIKDPLPLPSKVNPTVGKGVEKALLRSLAKDPAQRFESATAFAEALSAGLAEDTKGGTMPTVVVRGAVASTPAAPAARDAAASPRISVALPPVLARRPVVSGVAAAAVVVLVAGGVILASAQRTSPADNSSAPATSVAPTAPSLAARTDVRPDAGASAPAAPRSPAIVSSPPGPAATTATPGLALTGTVTRAATGTALAGVTVTVYRDHSTATPNQVATTTTDASGRFRAAVSPGTYQVAFIPPPAAGLGTVWWKDATDAGRATDVTISDATAVEISLPEGRDIVGRVTDAAGGQGLSVSIRARLTTGNCPTVTLTRSDSSGVFRLPVAKGTYVVSVSPPSPYVSLAYYRSPTCSGSPPLAVDATDVAGIDLSLARGSTVTGFVLDTSGAPLVTAHVLIYFAGSGATGASNQLAGEAYTDSQGRWSALLADGTYRVRLDGPIGAGYRTQWWNGALSFPRATDVVVKGATVTGITGQLTK